VPVPDGDPVAPEDTRTLSGERPLGPALVEQLGGRRGLVDSGLPAVVFVGVNALVDTVASRHTALYVAIAAAGLTGLGTVVLRLVRKEPVQQSLSGFLGLALAVFFAARSGEARDFFKPGIYINAGYGLVFLASAMIGRPLVGAVYAAVDGLGTTWREDRRLRRIFSVATVGWALVFALRGVVQTLLYNANRPDLLAVSRLLLGWPLTIAAVAATIAYVRRSHRRAAERGPGGPAPA
jgi:hypothetical protein